MVSPLTKQKKVMPLVTLVTYIEQLNVRILLELGGREVTIWLKNGFPGVSQFCEIITYLNTDTCSCFFSDWCYKLYFSK